MKKMLGLLGLSMMLVGCATPVPMGTWFTDLKLPVQGVAEDVSYTKVGVSKAKSYLAMFATGDCSLHAAIQNGGIKTVKYVDWEAKNVLGIVGDYTTTVYGD